MPYCSIQTLHMHACRKQLHVTFIVLLLSSSLVLVNFFSACITNVHNARRKQLHVTFIVMPPSVSLVLASFFPMHASQMLANYL